MITIRVDKEKCHHCLNCQALLNIIDDQYGFPKMPEMAFNGWEIRRLEEAYIVLLRDAVIECPGQALSIEE